MEKLLFNNKGQSLIEVLIALGAAVTVIVAITHVVISALNNAQFSRNEVLATQYAQEGIEFMRKVRDTDWNQFSSYADGSYCFAGGATSITPIGVGCGQNVDNFFIREIQILKNSSYCQPSHPAPTPTPLPTNGTQITVIVKWSDNKCTSESNLFCHSTKQVTCLTNYRIVPTP